MKPKAQHVWRWIKGQAQDCSDGRMKRIISEMYKKQQRLSEREAQQVLPGQKASSSLKGSSAQCADSEVRNAIERTPYIVVLKFHVFILISKSFNFRSPLDRILRYLTKT